MSSLHQDDLWRAFPRTALEFEERFAREEDCRAYWIEARWNGRVTCQKCGGEKVWALCGGRLYECAACGHQTSLTSGTLLAGTRKPFKAWFRAIFELSVHRHGISAKDLQRIMGFGSYKTAWTWLHKLRRALVRPGREPLCAIVQLDEGLVGGKGSEKSMVLVGAEPGGRVRLAHAQNNDEATLKHFADTEVAANAATTTDGLASYNAHSLGKRPHNKVVQTVEQRREMDALQNCHWAISNLKRWLLGTHHGAVREKHLQAYLDEFVFRYNRRKTKGVGRIAARVLENLVSSKPMFMRQLINDTKPCRLFQAT
jgi:transposase-like protein